MYRIKCKCGESEKNFKNNIGEFYIDECCEKAGYDHLGKTKEDYKREQELKEALAPLPKEVREEVKEEMEAILDEEDAKLSTDLKKMDQKKLRTMCDERGIKYAGNDSKAKLREKLK